MSDPMKATMSDPMTKLIDFPYSLPAVEIVLIFLMFGFMMLVFPLFRIFLEEFRRIVRFRLSEKFGTISSSTALERDFSKKIDALASELRNELPEQITTLMRSSDGPLLKELDERINDQLLGLTTPEIEKRIEAMQLQAAMSKFEFNNAAVQLTNAHRRVSAMDSVEHGVARGFRLLAVSFAMIGLASAIFASAWQMSFTNVGSELVGGSVQNEVWWSSLKGWMQAAPVILLSEILALVMFRYSTKASERARFYTNEATTLDFRRASLELTSVIGQEEMASKLIATFLAEERNRVLSKGEQYAENMNNAQEDKFVESVADKLKNVVPSNERENNKKTK